ncbi:MAG TPA: glycosyltransferase family 9 protein [Chitinophagaceae bacterium]|nr:glycosyltransferase family 9 protein [Chitinophagaceae bacterium]
MKTPRHILVFRFSALGDIAMTVPVIRCLLHQHPDAEITVVSVPFAAPLFEGMERLHFYPADIRRQYKGVAGLHRLAKQLKKDISFDAIADLHDVLRTKLLRFFLLSYRKKVIDKGRSEKKELTRAVNKKRHPLKTTFQRYADVFAALGLPVSLVKEQGCKPKEKWPAGFSVPGAAGKMKAGIAPFARHTAKMYPPDKMKEVVTQLAAQQNIFILLIGGKEEAPALQQWEKEIPGVKSIAGAYSFREELAIISQLDVMVSMDSANMHLASLFGVPVVSVWGGTHPWLGFYGWGQDEQLAIQADLPCRPSSVFGNKDCPVHGKAGCMQSIAPGMIADKVLQVLRAVPATGV